MLHVLGMLAAVTHSSALSEAQVFESRGDDVGAIQTLEHAVHADSAWAMGRLELGRLLLKNGRLEESFTHLDVARTLAPENPRGHYLFALAAGETARRNEAVQALSVALSLRQGYGDAQVRLASLLMEQGDFSAASALLQQYLERDSSAVSARLQLAEALERGGDLRGAERELRRLLSVASLKVLVGHRLVALLEQQGKHDEAQHLRQTLQRPVRKLRELQRSRR